MIQKGIKHKDYSLKGAVKNYNNIIDDAHQAIDSNIKKFRIQQYKEIRKLATDQGEDYTTGYLLGYDYIKNYYRQTAVDLNRQK